MMRRRWRRHRRHEAEMNITAFLNLMVILVPFLLITAVFSRIAILELTLPTDSDGTTAEEQSLQLEIILRADRIEVADRGAPPVVIANTQAGYDLARLGQALRRIKARVPDKTDAIILLEPDIAYDDLIQVMDTVRLAPVRSDNVLIKAELFPDIAIGDAPPRTTRGTP